MEQAAFCYKTQAQCLYNQRMGFLQRFVTILTINPNMPLKEQLKLLEQQFNGQNLSDLLKMQVN
jgi:hypothetical protein